MSQNLKSILPSDLVAVEYLPSRFASISLSRVEAAISSGLRVLRLGRLRFAMGSDLISFFPEP